jgi:hypothetical protein
MWKSQKTKKDLEKNEGGFLVIRGEKDYKKMRNIKMIWW